MALTSTATAQTQGQPNVPSPQPADPFAGGSIPSTQAGVPSAQVRTALIIYDSGTDITQAQVLQDLLGHFDIESTLVAQAEYSQGSLAAYDITFFINHGVFRQDHPVQASLLKDIAASQKTVVWMGNGLDQLEKIAPGTYARLGRDSHPASYIVRGGNLWHVIDVPMDDMSKGPGYLGFCDLLHDMVKSDHGRKHTALIRIEDVHPGADQKKLRAIADYLSSRRIPFSIVLIPAYKDPASGDTVSLSDSPDFVETIHYMQDRGGDVVLNGFTQLYGGEKATESPGGETATESELTNGDVAEPVEGESEGWLKMRLNAALEECWENGIRPVAWESPPYLASDLAVAVIAENIPVYYGDRDQTFYPFIISKDRYGQMLIPVNLGYVFETEVVDRAAGKTRQIPSAAPMLVVRDSVASASFQPFLDIDLLEKLTTDVQEDGFTYISLSSLIGPDKQIYPIGMSPRDYAEAWLSEAQRYEGPFSFIFTMGFAAFLAAFVALNYLGIIILSRRPSAPTGPADPEMKFVIVIPCLKEEPALAETLDQLMSLPEPRPLILVVHDDSDDLTRENALEYPRERVVLVDYPPGMALQGRGKLLDYAFRFLMRSGMAGEAGLHKVVMGVLDAGGSTETDVIGAIAPYFSDEKTAAVQVSVRITSAASGRSSAAEAVRTAAETGKTTSAKSGGLTTWQKYEFLTCARFSRMAREHLGSAGLGGNGQFVRLSALASLGDEPWTDSLTEDLDLGLRLMLDGWANHYNPDTSVSQQGASGVKALIRQRSRWFQGRLSTWRQLPALIASRKAGAMARMDAICYLLEPGLVFVFLPLSALLLVVNAYLAASSAFAAPWQYLPLIAIWYLFTFSALPAVVWAVHSEEKKIGLGRAFLWAHVMVFFNVIWFLAGCKAIWRLLTGKGSPGKPAMMEEAPS